MIPRTVTPLSSVLKLQLESDGSDVVGVLELEVAVDEHAGIGQKGSPLALVEPEALELVAVEQLLPGDDRRACLCGLPAPRAPLVFREQQLECPVDQGALQARQLRAARAGARRPRSGRRAGNS